MASLIRKHPQERDHLAGWLTSPARLHVHALHLSRRLCCVPRWRAAHGLRELEPRTWRSKFDLAKGRFLVHQQDPTQAPRL